MADVLTIDGSNPGVYKTFSLSTPNTLFSTDPCVSTSLRLEGSKFGGGRPFNPNRVTISYATGGFNACTKVKVFFKDTTTTTSGSVTYYDPTTLTKVNPSTFSKTFLPLASMPSWLSTIVLSQI